MAKSYYPYAGVILAVVLFLALWFGAISMLVLKIQPSLNPNPDLTNPTINITLYAGEISSSQMGFGLSSNNITSPGPTLRFKLTDVVNLTVVNAGSMPHAFAITEWPRTGAAILFNAEAGSGTNPISPGQQASVIFSPSNTGSSFYYICPISGHAEAGMWGSVIITA